MDSVAGWSHLSLGALAWPLVGLDMMTAKPSLNLKMKYLFFQFVTCLFNFLFILYLQQRDDNFFLLSFKWFMT